MHTRKPWGRLLAVTATAVSLGALASASLAYAGTPAPVGPQPAKVTVVGHQDAKIPCAKYLEKSHTYRSDPPGKAWSTYRTDKLGRPVRAQTRIGTVDQEPKPAGECAATVGAWGGPGYQGVRMLPALFKGSSQRANLLPLTKSVNEMLSEAAQAANRGCVAAHPEFYRFSHDVTATYKKNSDSVVPTRVTVVFVWQRSPETFSGNAFMELDNKNYTKAEARKQLQVFTSALTTCNA
ncbi:DNA/RNA non-specific endonuclease [Streptomyces sp. NPDC050523]|uniref:DNA/RNA non-specific endonuclease n=1 Tax=Streptomyces sp. NPDC050523 TaxID=3365622 RepID=UPI00379C3B02